MKTKLAIAAVIALLAAGGYWLYTKKQADDAAQSMGPTVTVRRGDLVEIAAASGTIEPDVQVEVKSRASGEVVELLVKEGDRVEPGQLLVRLDPGDAERALKEMRAAQRRIRAQLAEAQASVAVAELESKNATDSLNVSEQGKGLGLVSTEATRAAAHAASVAQANIKLRKAQLAAAHTQLETAQLDIEETERRLSETDVHAPIAGTVLSVDVEIGSIVASALTNVSGGTPLLTLADLTDLRVIGAIDEAQVGRVAAGQAVVIRVDAYPDQSFQGKVSRVSPLGKTETSVVTFDVEIVVTDEHVALLRSGMSADLEIVSAELRDVLLLPLSTIQSKGAMRFVRTKDGEMRKIKTGTTDGMSIVVLEGLEEGDEVMAAPSPPAEGGRPAGSARAGDPSRDMRRGMRQMGR